MAASKVDLDAASATDPNSQPVSTSRERFTFQNDWFDMIRDDWEELTRPLRGKKLNILEIGCFEGASTTWMLDHLMSHPDSRMTVIDTFEGGMEHRGANGSSVNYNLGTLESRFRSNISKCKHVSKLRVVKSLSDDALLTLRQDKARFDFIYIDASHIAIDVLHDAVLCWRMLEVQGTMVFDDLTWKGYNEDCYNPCLAILSFVQCVAQEAQTKETVSQMWVTKVPTSIPATPNSDPDLRYWDISHRISDAIKNMSVDTYIKMIIE